MVDPTKTTPDCWCERHECHPCQFPICGSHEHTDPEAEGYAAFGCGATNPYPTYSMGHSAWQRGWLYGSEGISNMTDHSETTAKPGDALRSAGIKPVSPWEFLARRMPHTKITPTIANELAAQTGTSPQFWLNMQRAYQGHD